MASITSFPILTRDWEGLLAATLANAEALVNIEPLRAPVEQALTDARTLKDRQEALTAQRQRATQELNQVLDRGREAARRLRAGIKSQLGTDNELLVHFNLPPRRKRGARKTAQKQPPQGTPPTTDPTPQSTNPQATVQKEETKS